MNAPQLLHELIATAVQAHGARAAIEVPPVDPGTPGPVTTYDELAVAADSVRRRLATIVRGESLVAILLPRSSSQLFSTQLGVLRSGAAFLCIDAAAPGDLLRFIVEDSRAVALLTDAEGRTRAAAAGLQTDIVIDVHEPAQESPTAAPPDWLTPASLAYVVYTSGTTGRPKGVMVEHRSITHLLRAEQERFALGPSDRCVMVSSPAYDSSIEESWLPLSAGATVVVADDEVTRLGPDLVPWLRHSRATVIMPTPTLLRMTACMDPATELPDLRVVYVGGEAMPQDLVDRWAPGRRLENGYGPTECTVTITRARIHAGRPVTIGQPVPGNTAWILDDALTPVPDGDVGELCIAGPNVARGYLNRPDLTAARFPTLPEIGRIYRTGDLVRRDDDGALRYLGRADTQVKVRGYRIELEEVEAQLAALDAVHAAACRVATAHGAQTLEAFYVPATPDRVPSEDELARQLGRALPAHMLPARFFPLEALPTTTSGKLDRRALPEPERPAIGAGAPPTDPLEAAIARALGAPIGLDFLGIDDDFFARGGDSLGVAAAVSTMRGHEDTAALTARDIYALRSVRRLAAALRSRSVSTAHSDRSLPTGTGHVRSTFWVSAAQVSCLCAALTAASLTAYAAIYLVLPWLLATVGIVPVVLLGPLAVPALLALYTPAALALAVATKRLLIGEYTAGRSPVWGGFYLRHWIVLRAVSLVPWRLLQGTVFYNAALRMLGAKIGDRVHIHRGVSLTEGGWDLLTIGDDVTLAQDASLGLTHLADGALVIGPVTLEEGCTLEVRAGVGEHTVVGAGAELSALSYLEAGGTIAAGARFDGTPARRCGDAAAPPTRTPAPRPLMRPAHHGVAVLATDFALRGLVGLPSFALAIGTLLALGVQGGDAAAWLNTPSRSLAACAAVLLFSTVALAARLLTQALVLRWSAAVPPGEIDRWSPAYIRVWLRSGLVESAGRWLAGSLFWRWWLRLAGMKLGANTEVSTILDVLPEQVALGDECFFADGVYVGGPQIRRGVVTTAPVEVGERVFIGNHVVIPAGTQIPPDTLVGVSTLADGAAMRPGSSWFGHPSFELPRREIVSCDRKLTHEPSTFLYLHRLCWEALRFAIPAVLMAASLAWLQGVDSFGALAAPLVTLTIGSALALAVCLLKWLLLGRVQPGQHGFWSTWCARWDFVYVAWGMLARGVLSPLAGTLLLPWYLRAMGVRVGRRVVLGGEFAQVVDPDMLSFGDHATLDRPMFQAHSFEDRVLKIDRVVIEREATVRRATVLFYGAQLGAGCHVAPHSVVMKGERLSPARRYAGAPTSLDSGGSQEPVTPTHGQDTGAP